MNASYGSLILASASPQRKWILGLLGVPFVVREASVEELADGDPLEVARSNALRKATAVWEQEGREFENCTVVGADTVVALDGRLFGKPSDLNSARASLGFLQGRTHTVVTAVAVVDSGGERVGEATTKVTFRQLSEAELEWYLATEEWHGRAGAYAIQGRGRVLVSAVEGDYLNVVGLPLATLLGLVPELKTFGFKVGSSGQKS